MKTMFLSAMALLALSFLRLSLTEGHIQGVVKDHISGQPIVSATVTIKGLPISMVTDQYGKFQLTTSKEKVTLIVNHSSYFTREIQWRGERYLEISLKPKSQLRKSELAQDQAISATYEARPSANLQQKNKFSGTPWHVNHNGSTPDFNTEDYDYIFENSFRHVGMHPTSTFSTDVDYASYSNIRRFLQGGNQPPKDAVRIEEMVNYFQYNYQADFGPHPLSIYQEINSCPWNTAHKLLHVGLIAKSIEAEDLPASNLVFLIDVSGSMQSANKLPLVKKSFDALLDQLRPHDRISVVTYAGHSSIALNSVAASEKGEIRHAIQNLEAGGSTAGAQGIQTAYQLAKENLIGGGNNRVILATDGDFNVGVSSDAALIRLIEKERQSGVYLSVLGFGVGNYQDNKMQKLAQHGNGNHYYIDQLSEAKKVLVHEFSGSMYTVANDVKIQLEFNPEAVSGYRLIGYENRLLNHEDFKNDKKDAGEIGAGHQVTALYEIIPSGIETSHLSIPDDLRYQSNRQINDNQNEWLTMKVRYKRPGKNQSVALEKVLPKNQETTTSNHFRWSAAVAVFGMILRDSEHRGDSDMQLVKKLAEQAVGKDPYGYRTEFLELLDFNDDPLLTKYD